MHLLQPPRERVDRGESSWIPDIRTERDWDRFLEVKVEGKVPFIVTWSSIHIQGGPGPAGSGGGVF